MNYKTILMPRKYIVEFTFRWNSGKHAHKIIQGSHRHLKQKDAHNNNKIQEHEHAIIAKHMFL